MENPKSSRVFTEGSSLPRESLLQSARYSTLSRDQFPVDEKAPKNKTPHYHFHSTSNTPQHPVSGTLTSFPTKTPQGSTSPSLNLNYSKKELVKLPKVMLDYAASLQTLDLSKNLFKEFPEEILKLTRLKTLKFEANYLKRIPAEISQLTQLENMSFASNYIVVVPKTIGKLAKTLQSLNLSYNHIGQFPKEITELSNLKVLHIQNNFFTSLPVQLNSLTSLKEIGLEWFKYTNPPLSAIQNDKSNFAIIKLFGLCDKIDEQNKTEFDFEDFINHFSLLGGNIFSMRDTLKRNLLHITAIEQEIGIVRYLAEHKESFLDEMDQDGQTPLSLAVREEKYFVARLLLSHGADPKIGGGPFGSALHMVTSKQHVVMIKELLKHGASPNITDAEGNTPLHLLFSVFSKSVETSKEIAKLLMDAGADLNQMNNDLWTPLHMAIRRGQLECVQWTVESNTRNKGKENKIFDINAEGGADKWTPIHLASVQANYEIMDILLENGAEMMNRTKTGKTPKDVVGNCQIAIKLLNKMEKRWVRNNLINIKKISAPGSEEGLRDVTVVANLENMRSIGSIRHIEERPTREVSQSQVEDRQEEPKRSTTSRQTDLRKSVSSFIGKRSLRIETQLSERAEYREGRGVPSVPTGKREVEKQEKQENGDVEDSLMIGDTDEVSEPKENFELTRVIPKSPNNIQKLQIVQNYRNHLSTLLSPKGSTIGTFEFTKTMTLESGRGTITNKQLQQQQNADMMQKFTFPNEFSKYISKFEHFTDEIKVFQNAILNGNDADMPTSEKLKCLFFMKAIHMKLNKQISKLNSELIPFELFIIFESIDDELKKQALTLPKNKISSSNHHDAILRSLHFIFENLENKDMAQSILIKAKISQMFGEFKYGTAKHFLQQLLQNYSESRFLRAEARCALKMLQGQQPTLNLRESLNEKKTSFLLALTSPKGDYLSNPLTRSIKASFLSPTATSTASSSLANNNRNNKKVPVYQEKCAEDIEDEEESVLMRKHIQSGLDKEKMRKVLENENLLDESQLSPPKEDESPEIKKIVPTRNRSMKIETKYTSPKIGAKGSFF